MCGLKEVKGVYHQSDGSLATVDIDASKGLIDQWEYFFVAKWFSMEEVFFLFRLNSNMFNISFSMGMFSY